MISHVFVGIADFDRAFRLYSAVMEDLRLKLKFSDREKPWAGWMAESAPRPLFLIGRPFDGNPAQCGNGNMIALLAPDRDAVARACQCPGQWRLMRRTARTETPLSR